MGQTISSSFVWKRGDQPAADREDDDSSCDEALDTADLVALPIELSDAAMRPTRATSEAAGFDLCASESKTVPPNSQWVRIGTGLKMAIGAHAVKQRLGADTVVYGAIRARSGLTSRGIDVFHGTIDADHRGEIKVLMRNGTDMPFEIAIGDRIAQLIFSISLVPRLVCYENIETALDTARGAGLRDAGAGPSSAVDVPVDVTIDV